MQKNNDMEIIVRNHANIPNKYVRFIKWKIRSAQRKFNRLIYTEVYISREGMHYRAVIKLGIPGNDIILRNQSDSLKSLWQKSSKDMLRYIRKHKEKTQAKILTYDPSKLVKVSS